MRTNLSAERPFSRAQLDACHSYILSQLSERRENWAGLRPRKPGPAITISHQTGAGAHEIAERLALLLQEEETRGHAPWTVFDRQLMEEVLTEHNLPQSLAESLPEDRRPLIRQEIDGLLGLAPPSWVVVPQVAETVLHLAEAGHVILVGRGANLIAARMPRVYHVRIVASLPRRIERVKELDHLAPENAARLIKQVDRARGRYVKAYFHAGVDDGLLYHLVINTDRVPCPEAAQLIADGARRCFQEGEGSRPGKSITPGGHTEPLRRAL